MIVLKKQKIFAMALIFVLCAFLIGSCIKICICNAPAYTVINRWYDNDNKRINLNDYSLKKDVTLHTTVTASQFVNPKLIIKAKNTNIMARTNGRIILDTKKNLLSGLGSHYYFIDANNLDDGMVYIHLSPKKLLNAKIQDTVYLTTQNDFMYARIVKKISLMIILIFLIHCLLFLLFSEKTKTNIFNIEKNAEICYNFNNN